MFRLWSKVSKTVTLVVVLYGSEIWSLVLVSTEKRALEVILRIWEGEFNVGVRKHILGNFLQEYNCGNQIEDYILREV
jgi:hypothetical protein